MVVKDMTNKRMTKMKNTAIILIILVAAIFITGCSTTPIEASSNPTNTQTSANVVEDLNVDDTIINPDIGTLDDTAVSEELPQ